MIQVVVDLPDAVWATVREVAEGEGRDARAMLAETLVLLFPVVDDEPDAVDEEE